MHVPPVVQAVQPSCFMNYTPVRCVLKTRQLIRFQYTVRTTVGGAILLDYEPGQRKSEQIISYSYEFLNESVIKVYKILIYEELFKTFNESLSPCPQK